MSAKPSKRRILIITGSRSEFGLLRPVMRAVHKHKRLQLLVAVAGEHLLAPAHTWKEVAKEFRIDAKIPMQRRADRGRLDHAAACARGMAGFAAAYRKLKPDWVVVLGDRIEAFAAASAASIAGIAVCHIHGGDRAEGIADEAMRHAITKLAHLHCAATAQSAERILKLGEASTYVHVTGSPAIDGLAGIKPISRRELGPWSNVGTVILHHPAGLPPEREDAYIQTILHIVDENAPGDILCLAPNHDPGREIILKALLARVRTPANRVAYALPEGYEGRSVFKPRAAPSEECLRNVGDRKWFYTDHLPRTQFLRLLKFLREQDCGLLVGNSSAGLIEAAALGVRVLNVGPRQAGRERFGLVEDLPEPATREGDDRTTSILSRRRTEVGPSPFGDGRAGPRIAALLAKFDPHDPALLRKRNSY
ncbi:MAG TPA: UDP-N-acetylglucosamine 2-epimerase [Phycisphaerales bacterium]|nr:UDP-N-acetylglucosamine 2-epimerase [Phycisphaerales bacterium]